LFVAASTGESVLLDEDDRRALTVAAREAAPQTAALYVGVAGLGSKQTIRYARNAAADGADVAVAMAPYFMKMSQGEVAAYFLEIAEASPIPIALYNHPRMTTSIDVETVAQVARHENVVAVKDTSTTVERIQSLIAATRGVEVSILQGNESLAYESLKLGANGMVTALAGVVPEWHAKLLEAVKGNHAAAAHDYHTRIVELWNMFRFEEVSRSISSFACAIKLALRRRGWLDRLDGMLPGFTPDAKFIQLIEEHLTKAGVPTHDGRAFRMDQRHDMVGDQSAVA
jgi:4-hydroxy-tetrahydrodipicolinate synthase